MQAPECRQTATESLQTWCEIVHTRQDMLRYCVKARSLTLSSNEAQAGHMPGFCRCLLVLQCRGHVPCCARQPEHAKLLLVLEIALCMNLKHLMWSDNFIEGHILTLLSSAM